CDAGVSLVRGVFKLKLLRRWLNVRGIASFQFSVFSFQFSVFSVQCSVFSVQCSVFSVQCSVFSVQCSVFSVQWESCRWLLWRATPCPLAPAGRGTEMVGSALRLLSATLH